MVYESEICVLTSEWGFVGRHPRLRQVALLYLPYPVLEGSGMLNSYSIAVLLARSHTHAHPSHETHHAHGCRSAEAPELATSSSGLGLPSVEAWSERGEQSRWAVRIVLLSTSPSGDEAVGMPMRMPWSQMHTAEMDARKEATRL